MRVLFYTLLTVTGANSFLSGNWTESLKKFLKDAQYSIEKGSEQVLTEIGKEINSVNFTALAEQSKAALQHVAGRLQLEGGKIKDVVMKKAERTLRGAGDEVEGFFSEVPNRVSDGFEGILTSLREALSWVLRNIIAPILLIVILLALLYLFVVSGCCGCCCSALMSQCGNSLENAFKQLKRKKSVSKGNRIIVLSDIEAAMPLQDDLLKSELIKSELLKNAKLMRI